MGKAIIISGLDFSSSELESVTPVSAGAAIHPTTLSVGYKETSQTLWVTCADDETEWKLVSNADWMVVDGSGKDTGSGSVTVDIAAAVDTSERTGTLTLTVTGTGYSVTVTVVQEAIPTYAFTIDATPSDATVTINGEETSSVEVVEGTEISWSVEADKYISQSGSYTMGTEDYTLEVTLVALYTFAITTNVDSATVTINGEETSSVEVVEGTEISWSVEADKYISQSGSYTMGTEDYTLEVTLVALYTFAITTNVDSATVTINGEETSSVDVVEGTEISWSVEADGYIMQSGSYTMGTKDYKLTITLKEAGTVTITINLEEAGTVSVLSEKCDTSSIAYMIVDAGEVEEVATSLEMEAGEHTVVFFFQKSEGVPAYLCYECTDITAVAIDNVTYICRYAFYGCTSLATVSWDEDSMATILMYAFYKCTALVSIPSFTSALSTIGTNAFSYCEGITSLDLSETRITSVKSFNYCTSLTTVYFPTCLTTVGGFRGCTALNNVDLSSTAVTEISDYGFYGCTSLTDISLPSSLTTIGVQVFRGCTALVDIEIPENVATIGKNCFEGCTKLTTVVWNDTAEISIDDYLFSGCTGMVEAQWPNVMTTVPDGMFYGCTGLTSVVIPSTVTILEGYVFRGCTGLTSIDIPSGVTSMGNNLFYYCHKLESVILPEGITSLPNSIFGSCYALTSIDIPSGVASIGTTAFQYCKALVEIICRAETPPTITSTTFGSGTGATGYSSCGDGTNIVCVPSGCVDVYEEDEYWSVLLDEEHGFTFEEIAEETTEE